jgi:hypothetical protein
MDKGYPPMAVPEVLMAAGPEAPTPAAQEAPTPAAQEAPTARAPSLASPVLFRPATGQAAVPAAPGHFGG